MESQWLSAAKRLQALASTGLHYCHGEKSDFDRERYEEIGAIAHQLLASLADVPVERIEGLVPGYAKGYDTPKVDVRGAVLQADEVLLVRERSDGLWTLPGGFADVGLSAADNTVKEILEEACVSVEATALYAVRHKARHAYNPDTRDFYKLFFTCRITGDATPAAGPEVTEARFFQRGRLPPLSTERVLPQDIEAAFEFRDSHAPVVLFD